MIRLLNPSNITLSVLLLCLFTLGSDWQLMAGTRKCQNLKENPNFRLGGGKRGEMKRFPERREHFWAEHWPCYAHNLRPVKLPILRYHGPLSPFLWPHETTHETIHPYQLRPHLPHHRLLSRNLSRSILTEVWTKPWNSTTISQRSKFPSCLRRLGLDILP